MGKVSEINMNKVTEELRNTKLSYREAEKQYQLPKNTWKNM